MQLPTTIDRFVLEELLGGGPSKVYRASDTLLERTVAVRILPEIVSLDSELRVKFLAQARKALNVCHVNIIHTFEDGIAEPQGLFVVMEFLRGEELGHAISDGRTGDLRDKLWIALQIASALEYLHRQAIVHCDLRPEKILLTEGGIVKLMDSAIAQFGDGAPYCTAPEESSGRKLPGRADIFVFGALLFHLISGVSPGNLANFSMDVLRKAGLPRPVRLLISQCTAPDPADRPDGFTPICEALDRIVTELNAGPTSLLGSVPPMAESITRAEAPPAPPSEFTRLFQAPATPPAPPAPIERPLSEAGEFTRQFKQPPARPASSARSMPAPSTPRNPVPATRRAPEPPNLPRPIGRATMAAPSPAPCATMPSAAVAESSAATQERALDLAMAKTAVVLRPVELHALLRQCESPSLAQLLAQDPDSTLRPDAVRSRKFGLEFFRDATGTLRPIDVTMRVIAPSFDPPEIRKLVRVRPDQDSERQVFLLTPKLPGVLQVQFDLLAGDITIASRCLTLDAAMDAAMDAAAIATNAPGSRTIVSVPIELLVSPRRRWVLPLTAAVVVGLAVWGLALWQGNRQPAEPAAWRPLARALIPTTEGRVFDNEPALAIAVGINEYSQHSGVNNLSYAVNDAHDIGQALAGHGYHVRTLLDSEAPVSEIRAALRDVHAQLAPDTGTVIFFFSGHGVNREGKQYLLTYGASMQDLREALLLDDLRDLMDATHARQKVILIDACRNLSGTDQPRGDSGPDFSRLRLLARSRGLRILNSTEPGQRSWEYADLKHGLFTSALLQALGGGFSRPDRYVTFADVANQTFLQMSTESFDDVEHRRNPQTPWEGGEASGDFVLEHLVSH